MKIRRNSLHTLLSVIGVSMLFVACKNDEGQADAYGNFEAVETIVSSKSSGEVLNLKHDEGEVLKAGTVLLISDTSDLILQRSQLLAQKNAVLANLVQVKANTGVLEENISGLEIELKRVKNLLQDGAATQKQKDDMDSKMRVLKKQRSVHKANLRSIQKQAAVFDAQIKVIDKKIDDCNVTAPISGTILERYVEMGELIMHGKPLFKMADMSSIILRVYVSGQQLESVKTGNLVNVKIDAADGSMKTFEGTVAWVASEAEFTPKVVQTKKERVKQVYATKIRVKNDGSIKIGMPGEVYFK